MPEVEQIWEAVSAQLKDTIANDDVFTSHIAVNRPVSIDSERLVLEVDSPFLRDWIENSYKGMISDALTLVTGTHHDVVWTVKDDGQQQKQPSMQKLPATTQQPQRTPTRRHDPNCIGVLNPDFTFDEFVVGSSNSFTHSAALAVTNSPGTTYNPLFIYGDTGLGKTHLMQAVGHEFLKQKKKVAYITTEELLNEYSNAILNKTTLEFRNKYRKVDLLLIDDIQFFAGKQGLQEEFFHTFNALYNDKKQIIITSDRPASEIAGLEQRLVSRFNAGMATQMESPNYETRLAILRYKQASTGRPLSDEIQKFIAENVTSNVRALEGAMNRAMALRDFAPDEPLTVEKLRYVLRDLLEKEKEGDLTLDAIQRAVAEFFDIRRTDLLSTDRMRSVAVPRQIAMYLCRRLTHASLPEIGVAFEKTHGTVVHACSQIQGRITVEPDLRANIRAILEKLGQDPAALEI